MEPIDLPVRIRGRHVEYRGNERRARFTGDVVVLRSTATLWCDTLETVQGTEEAVAEGHVRFLDGERRMDLTCDRLHYAHGLRQLTADGHCRMVAGDPSATTLVTSEEMEVWVDTREAEARGTVVIEQAADHAECARAHLYGAEDRAVLTGRPRLKRPPHEFECDTLTTWLRQGRSVLTGHVSGRMVPEKMEGLAPPEPAR